MKYLLVALATVSCISALSHYIKPCYLKKPDFNKCALEHGNYAIPFVAKGDKQRDFPPLNPLTLPLIEIIQNNFRLALKDLKIHGLDNAKLADIKMNKTYVEILLRVENLQILGDYEIGGKVLFLSLEGSGFCNITAVGGNYKIISTFDTYRKGQENYLKYNKPVMEYKLQKAYFNFDKLLDSGDKKIGIDINKLLNDNWEDVLKDIDAPLKDTVTTIIESMVSKLIKNIPKKDIFPD